MKIALLAPIIERVPPKKYGGTERVIYNLAEELVKKGHDVTLFASGDSLTSAKLVSVYPRSLREVKIKDLYGPNILTMLNIGLVYQEQDKFDIIHDHIGHLSLPTANISKTPVVITMHGPFTAENKKIFETLNNPYMVTISKSQTFRMPLGVNHAGTVYNGLAMENYPFSKNNEGYLLSVGRISMEKGTHLAIEVAQHLNLPLIIAAKLESTDMQYFNEYIGLSLSDQIRWVGEVDEEERNRLFSKALCSLHPNTWREPFGLTIIEAMACGCPVIGFNEGSIPELIENGKTGYVVNDVEEMIEGVLNINKIDRQECRKHALENFNSKKMADGYEAVYKKILKQLPKKDTKTHKLDSNYPLALS